MSSYCFDILINTNLMIYQAFYCGGINELVKEYFRLITYVLISFINIDIDIAM